MHRLENAKRRPARRESDTERRGAACVEFALVLPILMTFILGVLEIGRYVEVRQIMTAAAREGARRASTGQMTNAQVINAVTGYIQAAGLPTANLTVTVNNLTNPAFDVSQATSLDNLRISVSILFTDVRWCSAVKWTDNTSRVISTVYWSSSNPVSYPNNVSAPAGS